MSVSCASDVASWGEDPAPLPQLGHTWQAEAVPGTVGRESSGAFLARLGTNAELWAREFIKLHGGDEDMMLGWFANAIMAGWDEGVRRERVRTPWAAVADALPPNDGNVILANKWGVMGRHSGSWLVGGERCWWIDDDYYDGDDPPTHWIELPEVPRG